MAPMYHVIMKLHFLPLKSNVQLSTFIPDSNEAYLHTEMSDVYGSNHVDSSYSHIAFSSTVFESLGRTSINQND